LNNINLARSVAKKFARNGDELKDLTQEGILGLFDAAKRFDGSRGFKFSTMAVDWVMKRVREASFSLRKTVRLPTHLSWKTGLPVNGINPLRMGTVSYHFGCAEDAQTGQEKCVERRLDSLCSVPATQEDLLQMKQEMELLLDALMLLNDNEFFVVFYYFFCCMTFEEIGAKLNVAKQRVDQIMELACMKIRKHIAFADLKGWFGLK
jgi:RNA polymerase sigma factor (sigma-70 family)